MKPRVSRLVSRWTGIVGLAVLTGCYEYTSMATPVAGDRTSIRIDLTDAGSVALAPVIGQRVGSIDGRSIGVSDTAVAVNVQATISQSGVVAHWNNERVDVPRSAISRIQGRRLDTRRSILAGLAAIAGALVVGEVFGLDLGLGGLGSGKGTGSRQ